MSKDPLALQNLRYGDGSDTAHAALGVRILLGGHQGPERLRTANGSCSMPYRGHLMPLSRYPDVK